MIAKQFCGEIRSLFFMSPILAAVLSFLGLWAGHAWNLPPGQAAVGVMCFALLGARGTRQLWDRMGV